MNRLAEQCVVHIVQVDNVSEIESCVLRDIPENFDVNISQENDEHVPEQIFIFHIERLHDLTLKYLCMKLIELGTLGVTGEEVVIRLVHLNNFCFFKLEPTVLPCELALAASQGLGQTLGTCASKHSSDHFLCNRGKKKSTREVEKGLEGLQLLT